MKNYKNSAVVLLVLTYVLFVALILFAFLLPKGAYWYTDIKHRTETLPIVIISTCYPCIPFAFLALISMRKIAKNILNDNIFTKEMHKNFFLLGLSCLSAGLIMFVAGFFYFPFFVSSAGALISTLIIKVFSDIFRLHLSEYKKETPKTEEKAKGEE